MTSLTPSTRRHLLAFVFVFSLRAHAAPVEVASDGAWTWFNDERAILHRGNLFAGYVKSDGTVAVARWNVASGERAESVLSTKLSTQKDDHDNPSLTALPDGRLLAIYSLHNSLKMFHQRISKGPAPGTLDDWSDEVNVPLPAGNTYSNTYRLTAENNRLFNFSRCIAWNPTLSISDDNAASWQTPRHFIAAGTGRVRPYPRYSSNGIDRIDLIYTDGHPNAAANSLYHLFYRGGSFHLTDGKVLKTLGQLPLQHDQGERGTVIYPFTAKAWSGGEGPDDWIPNGRAWSWDIHRNAAGEPVCVFTVQVDRVTGAGPKDARIYYYYARWNGRTWARHFIAHAGRPLYLRETHYAGGICLDPADPSVLYLSTNAARPFALQSITDVPLAPGERYEIWRGTTRDGGKTFQWTSVTKDSPADNLRPTAIAGDGKRALLWFQGAYTTYKDYRSRVLAQISEGP